MKYIFLVMTMLSLGATTHLSAMEAPDAADDVAVAECDVSDFGYQLFQEVTHLEKLTNTIDSPRGERSPRRSDNNILASKIESAIKSIMTWMSYTDNLIHRDTESFKAVKEVLEYLQQIHTKMVKAMSKSKQPKISLKDLHGVLGRFKTIVASINDSHAAQLLG